MWLIIILKHIANDILQGINKYIMNIKDNIHKDYGDTIVNFNIAIHNNKVELFLFIIIDRSKYEMIKNKNKKRILQI
jgi:hypothetical protein